MTLWNQDRRWLYGPLAESGPVTDSVLTHSYSLFMNKNFTPVQPCSSIFTAPNSLVAESPKDVVSSTFYYQPLKEGELRLLVLLPSPCPNEPIRCRLIASNICEVSDRFRYERSCGIAILSLDDSAPDQVDGRPMYTIQMNSVEVPVSHNLFCALRQFRNKTEESTLWVENLCVDQSNLLECAIQALMMRCIYFLADATYLWVGETADDSDLAMNLISTFSSLYDTHSISPPDKDYAFLQLLLDPAYELHWRAMATLLERPYFGRISTIQEIAIARNSVLWCGNHCIPWHAARSFLKKCTAWTQFRVPPTVQLLAEMK